MSNEPNMERARGSPGAKAYNRVIQGFTVRYTMLDWLENPPQLWKEVVVRHFLKNRKQIMQSVTKWAQEPGIHAGPGQMGMVTRGPGAVRPENITALKPRLHTALQNLGGPAQRSNQEYGGQGRATGHGQRRKGGFGSGGCGDPSRRY